MKRILDKRPSPAMVVAFVALSVALAGTANALPGKNRVKRDDIARNAVRTSDIVRNAIRTRHIRSRQVTRSKIASRSIDSNLVATDALTGDDILESSLKTVPSATDAERVNGLSVQRFNFKAAAVAGSQSTNVVTVNGVTLAAACDTGPALAVRASTNVSGAIVHSGGTYAPDTPFYNEDDQFNTGDSFDALDNPVSGSNSAQGTLTYLRPDGATVTATFLTEETGANECIFSGTVTG